MPRRIEISQVLTAPEVQTHLATLLEGIERVRVGTVHRILLGQSRTSIAAVLGRSTRWVKTTINRYNSDGLRDRSHNNPVRLCTCRLKRWLDWRPFQRSRPDRSVLERHPGGDSPGQKSTFHADHQLDCFLSLLALAEGALLRPTSR